MRTFKLVLLLAAFAGFQSWCQEAHVVSVSPDKGGLNDIINVQIVNLGPLLKGASGTPPNGDLTFPQSSLVLLGISSATALGAVIVDPIPPKNSASGLKRSRAPAFISGLLDDGDGTSFHRFQIFGWTIILGIIFITKVIEGPRSRKLSSGLAQPTFDDTFLTLMGISSGTYIGFKFTEKPPKGG